MPGSNHDGAQSYVDDLRSVLSVMDCQVVDRLTELLYELWRDDRQVVVFGNGGSACTASHFVTDLAKTAAVDGERPLRTLSLVDNNGLMTAVGNDLDYDQIFTYAIKVFTRAGDAAIAISGSGNSPNVANACRWARDHDVRLVCLTGFDGGAIGRLAELHINVPSTNYGVIEDVHLSIGHIVSQALKARVAASALLPS